MRRGKRVGSFGGNGMAEKAVMRRAILIVLLTASLCLSACAHKRPKPGTPESPNAANAGAEGAGADYSKAGPDDEAAGPQAGRLAERIVNFDFDSSEIKGAGTDVVAAHAKFLASHTATRVRLEGHTDERGSREYNIGLGERRAQSVRRALLLQGASDAQLSTVSYGEERPAVAGHDEAAWAKNRRVEIVYLAAPAPKP
jgi:peptidoglycan-associated lipoprotein